MFFKGKEYLKFIEELTAIETDASISINEEVSHKVRINNSTCNQRCQLHSVYSFENIDHGMLVIIYIMVFFFKSINI